MTLQVLGRYVRGTAIIALTESIVIGVALLILRVPLALPLAAGVIFAGIIGAVLAVPLAAVTWAVINVWTQGPADTPPAPVRKNARSTALWKPMIAERRAGRAAGIGRMSRSGH